MEFNLNMLFDKLANFKMKFTEKPSPVEISNKSLIFAVEDHETILTTYEFKEILYNPDIDIVMIILKG